MSALATSIWLILTLILGGMAILVVWSRSARRSRPAAALVFALSCPATALAIILTLGWSTPILPYISSPHGEVTILGFKLVPDEAIFVLVDDGSFEPRYYRLPWDNQQAMALAQAQQEASEDGGERVGIPAEFERREGSWSMIERPDLDVGNVESNPLKMVPPTPPRAIPPHL